MIPWDAACVLSRDLAPCCSFVMPGREMIRPGTSGRCQPDNGLGFQGENAPKSTGKSQENHRKEKRKIANDEQGGETAMKFIS